MLEEQDLQVPHRCLNFWGNETMQELQKSCSAGSKAGLGLELGVGIKLDLNEACRNTKLNTDSSWLPKYTACLHKAVMSSLP